MTNARPESHPLRNAELARIHILADELGLSREEYRDVVFTVTRRYSAADLDFNQRRTLLDHLTARLKSTADWGWVNGAAADKKPLLRKIKKQLESASRGKNYVDGIAKRMFAIERVEFCAPDQLRKIVAALNYDRKRKEMTA